MDVGDLVLRETMYFIVCFVDTEEVEVVPAIWVMDGVCLWPPYKAERVQRAAKHLEQPQESWSAYKVEVMYTANTYSEGCCKLTLAQQTELQSEAVPDSLTPPKWQTKRDKGQLDGYDSDEEAETPLKNDLPQAPQLQPLCSASKEQPSPLGQSQNQPPNVTQSAETSRPSLLKTGPVSEWRENSHQISQQLPSSSDPFISSLLHEILTKQEILMEQQGTIMRIVQDLKANDVSETTEANHFSPEQCPIEDSFEVSASLESYPETSVQVETYSGSKDNEMACEDNESHPVRIRKKRIPKIGTPCGPTCRKKCTEKILHVRRKEIFDAYQDMSHSDRWAFVFHSVTQALKTGHTNSNQYHLNNSLGQPQEVCRTFYLTTLGYKPQSTKTIAKVIKSTSVRPPDCRGRPKKINTSLICEQVKSFNLTTGDCSCEQAEGRLYLPSNVTISMMYKDYKGKSSTPCTYTTYRNAIRGMNIVKHGKHKECDIHVKTEHL